MSYFIGIVIGVILTVALGLLLGMAWVIVAFTTAFPGSSRRSS